MISDHPPKNNHQYKNILKPDERNKLKEVETLLSGKQTVTGIMGFFPSAVCPLVALPTYFRIQKPALVPLCPWCLCGHNRKLIALVNTDDLFARTTVLQS